MKIGVDIDGVILNFERELKTYGELYNFLELKKGGVVNPKKHYLRERYDWTEEERQNFISKYFVKLTKQTAFMPGAVDVLKMLQADGHKLVIISARGGLVPEMIDVALEKFESVGLVFDKCYWAQHNKLETALAEKLDFIIDDYAPTCQVMAENKIHALYFRDVNMLKIENNDYLTEVNNWGEIYRIVRTSSK